MNSLDSYEMRISSWPGRIRVFQELPSTNSYLLNHLGEFGHLDVIVAEDQVAGRGRHRRTWLSEQGKSLTFSILFDINQEKKYEESSLPQVVALALSEFLELFEVTANLKWPNDILLGRLKIAGILCELRFSEEPVKKMVVGIGINLNQSRSDFQEGGIEATSLLVESGRECNSMVFFERFLNFVFPFIDLWYQEGFEFFVDKYKKRCGLIGSKVLVKRGEETYQVKVNDITQEGYLSVKGAHGKEFLTFGEIVT